MIRLGILDFDSSHCVAFTQRLNHIDVAQEHWVEGARVVIGCPGESKLSPERIPGYTEQMKKYGVPLVDDPADMIGKVDAMLIESVDGSVHRERARPFLEAGIPCFVDKPFATSLADARAMVDLAARKKVPVFSSSSLRYAPDVVAYSADPTHGRVLGCVTYGPASLHERNPGLFHYGIHAVEILYALMGRGCERVTCTHQKDADVVTGTWKDGRVATVRGTRTGAGAYGFVGFAEKGTAAVRVDATYIYRELLKKIVETFQSGKPPVDPAETLELVAFIEGAYKSGNNHGAVETIKV